MAIRFLICHFAPRPAAEPAVRAFNLGLALPPGLGRSAVRASWITPYWRMRRHFRPDRQFHALGRLGRGRGHHERALLAQGLYPVPAAPAPCALCGQRNPKGLQPHICAICLEYYTRHGLLVEVMSHLEPARRYEIAETLPRGLSLFTGRPGSRKAWYSPPMEEIGARLCDAAYHLQDAELRIAFLGALEEVEGLLSRPARPPRKPRIARPIPFRRCPAHMLRASRQRPHAILALPAHLGRYASWKARPRTQFAYSPTRAKYFTRRRDLVARALARGYELIKAGLWYDRAADMVYCQSAVDLRPVEQVQLRRGA